MDDELVPLDSETGEYEDGYVTQSASADSFASILVILTTVFLLISIAMLWIRLYSAYDIGKSPQEITQRENSVSRKP